MKRSGKEVTVVYSSYYSDIFLERLTKTKLNLKIDGVPAEVRIQQLLNTSIFFFLVAPTRGSVLPFRSIGLILLSFLTLSELAVTIVYINFI
jgi:hypothetical protein